jgi:hypothetical protein
MLSSVTVALAMLAVTADAPGQPAGFRLLDYVHKSEVKTASATSESTRAPVRMAQAPMIAAPVTPAMSGLSSMPHMSHGYPGGGEMVMGSMEGYTEDFGGPGCVDCGPSMHYPHYKKLGWWGMHGLPGPWHSPGDMHGHIPYLAMPKNYYYFRPYQWFHIPEQQAEVTSYGGDPRHPYANREFEEVYQEFETPPPAEFDIQPTR